MESTAQKSAESRIVDYFSGRYGWVILIVGIIGVIMSSPGQTYSVSIFLEHIREDLGINRTTISLMYTIGTVTGSFMLPIIGRQLDVRGPRLMMILTAVLFGLACFYMGWVRNAAMLAIGFVGIRMLGQGSTSLISRQMVNLWWVERRGTILGIMIFASALLGPGSFPILINWLIPQYGWRVTYPILGGLVVLVMVPVAFFFYRGRPELFGLLPDGRGRISDAIAAQQVKEQVESENELSIDAQLSAEDLVEEENWTLGQVARTGTFWLILLAIVSFDMLGTGVSFHIVSIFTDAGLSADLAAAYYFPMSIMSAVVALSGGFLIDRIEPKYMLSFGLFVQAVSYAVATIMGTPAIALAFVILRGLNGGLARTLSNVLWPKYYGRDNLGAISGFATTFGVIGSGLGPLIYGFGRDISTSYTPVLWITAVMPLVLGVAVLFLQKPSLKDFD
ncbi:MAG: MFS transporter [Chloroflexota bacterium]